MYRFCARQYLRFSEQVRLESPCKFNNYDKVFEEKWAFYRFLWLAESHHGINLLLDITEVSLLPEFFMLTSHSLGPYHVQRWIITRHATPPITPPGSDEGLAIWVAIWAAINATPRVRESWWYWGQAVACGDICGDIVWSGCVRGGAMRWYCTSPVRDLVGIKNKLPTLSDLECEGWGYEWLVWLWIGSVRGGARLHGSGRPHLRVSNIAYG